MRKARDDAATHRMLWEGSREAKVKATARFKLWAAIGVVATLLAGAGVGCGVFFALRHYDSVSPTVQNAQSSPFTSAPAASAADLLYLFDKPAEPIFSPRGINRDVVFDVPPSFLPERYMRRAAEVLGAAAASGARIIPVEDLPMAPERFADVNAKLPFRSPYTRSAPPFLALAVRFWRFFHESRSVSELLSRAVWARLHYNPEMILDALLLAMLRSPLEGVKDVQLPELPQYFPELYVDDEFFAKTREEMHMVPKESRVSVPVIRNRNKDEEVVLWYFREDPHFHVFHWKWHVVYPAGTESREYVDLPRRGEMFVQLHRQYVARYNAERFVNGMAAVEPLDVHRPLPGYFPKMAHLHGGKGTIGRQDNTSLLAMTKFIQNHDAQVAFYKEVLKLGFADFANGTRVNLQGIEGMNIVSNLLEGNPVLSPNYTRYGNIHNDLHANLARAHDPLGVFNEPLALPSYITTVARDPVFYKIHSFMDNLYEMYKSMLPPYSKIEMTPLPKVAVQSVTVRTEGAAQEGELRTYFQHSELDVSMGLDYMPAGRQYARFTHLQHRPFEFVVKINNDEEKERRVFVRLFLLVQEDETGSKLDLDYQRRFSLQLDTFDVKLVPGANTVRRPASASALTVDTDAVYTPQTSAGGVRRRNACRCGWPQGLLVPRGTVAGTPYKLFAMVTDYDQDRAPLTDSEVCRDGWMLCGAPGSQHYPDVRAMGFPLDRPFRAGVATLDDFLTVNMAVGDVVVRFENVTEGPSALLPGGVSTTWMPR